MYYAPQSGATRIGAEFTYSLASRALRITGVVPGRNAEKGALRAADEILAINNAKLDTLTPYYEAVGRGTLGDTTWMIFRTIFCQQYYFVLQIL
jgi:S1-C subfamily serine protease